MTLRLLDELPVPQPPYRMRRPVAVLAMADEFSEDPTPTRLDLSAVEVPAVAQERQDLSPVESIAERDIAMEAVSESARAEVRGAPAIAEATPAEVQQDAAGRQAAAAGIDAADAQRVQQVHEVAARAYETAADYEKERERLEQIANEAKASGNEKRAAIAMHGAAMLGPMIAQKRASEARLAEAQAAAERRQQEDMLRAEQEERARKEDIEFKKSVTRSQSAAIKEDAVRDEQNLAEGIEFAQPEETAAARAGRLGQAALRTLNEFKDAQDRGAKPEELEFARQRADIAQKRVEAAKRGEPQPEDRVNMRRVEAAGTEAVREAALAQRTQEAMAAMKAADEAQDTVAFKAAGRAFMEARKELLKIRDRKEDRVFAARQQEDAQDAVAQDRATGEGMASAPATEVPLEELPVVEAEPMVGTIVPEKGKVVGYESSGKAIYEVIRQKPRVSPTADELEAYQQQLRRSSETAVRSPDAAVNMTPQSPEGQRVTAVRQRAAEHMARQNAAEAAPAPRVETGPSNRERDLEEQVQRLRAQLEARQQSAAGVEAGARTPEGAPKSGGVEEALLREIMGQENKKSERPSWFGQQLLKLEAVKSEVKAQWHGIWAKRCKDLLQKRETQLKTWETAAAAFKEKSYGHTALGILTHDPVVWALRKSVENFSKRLENREIQRKRHLEERADLLNFAVAREDASRKVSETRAKAAEMIADQFDKEIDRLYIDHKKATAKYAEDPQANSGALEESQSIEVKLRKLMKVRAEAMHRSAKEGKVRSDKQEQQNLLLDLVNLPVLPALSGKAQRRQEVRKKPKAA